MDKRALFEDVISGFLSGTRNPDAIVAVLMQKLPQVGNPCAPDDMLGNCEWALRHLGEWDRRTTEEELRYYRDCLRNEKSFNLEEIERIRKGPPQTSTMPLCPGVSVEVHAQDGYSGLVLVARDALLTQQLDRLQGSLEFKDLLNWFEVRVTMMGGRPHCLVRSALVPKFLREVRLFLELRFSEGLGG